MIVLIAQEQFNLQPGGYSSNIQDIKITQIVSATLVAIVVIAVVIFFFVIVGGWITAITKPNEISISRNWITAAIIGLAIIFSSWAIANLIEIFFGIDLFGALTIQPVSDF